MLHIGHGNYIRKDYVSVIMKKDSRPAGRLVKKAKEEDRFLNLTGGREANSLIITTDHKVIFSSFETDTMAKRMDK